MVTFRTSTGTVAVETWGYELQGRDGAPLDRDLLASATHDLLVIDSSRDGTNALRFSADDVTRMKDGMGGRSVVVSYISIGEASDFRDYWQPGWTETGLAEGDLDARAPDWLGPLNPDWPESRKVRFWDEEWQDILFNDARTGDVDAIVAAGFDAAYLDIVDGYYFWGTEVAAKDRQAGDPVSVKQAAQRMVDFVVALTEHARETNPDFFVIPQNGAWILNDLGNDTARREAYLDVIGGIAVEDLYYRGARDENNPLRPDAETIEILKQDFLSNGKPVFSVDYVNGAARVAEFDALALADGFIPFAAPTRGLDRLVGTHDGDPAYILPTGKADILRGSVLADRIDGLAGNDRVDGRAGADRLLGGAGNDTLFGGDGNDTLFGGAGKDRLKGGAGDDVFVFATALDARRNVDRITDFSQADDTVKLDDDVFLGLATGRLAKGAFAIGTRASDADDRILHDTATGDLFFDRDGSAATYKPVLFAHLTKETALAASDFLIIG
ncbi:endo alpha-1,4 polygalactosaminidase [Methylobacterium sp. CM6244]